MIDRQKAIKAYQDTRTLRGAAKVMGCTHERIRQILKAKGVPIQPHGVNRTSSRGSGPHQRAIIAAVKKPRTTREIAAKLDLPIEKVANRMAKLQRAGKVKAYDRVMGPRGKWVTRWAQT